MLSTSLSHGFVAGKVERISAYLSLTKPLAVAMIAMVTCVGMALANSLVPVNGSEFELVSWAYMLMNCLFVAISSAGTFALNQYYERDLDSKMVRARERALPSGKIDPNSAIVFGLVLFIVPLIGIYFWVTPGCALATFICGASYVWVYTPLKVRSSMSTFVGAIPGALIPLMGWLAVRNDLNINVFFLMALLFVWQIPHALVIVLRHFEDYQAAGMKQLPIVMGREFSMKHLVLSTVWTGLLSLSALFWVEAVILYVVVTLIIFVSTVVLAVEAVLRTEDFRLSLFFIVHLLSLPLQLIVFFVSI